MRADFLDVSEPNIHPVWETTVLLWISKLPWLKQRVPPNFEQATRARLAAPHPPPIPISPPSHPQQPRPCFIPPSPHLEQATRESLAAYFKTKPWARRAHPSIVAQGEEAEEVRRLRHARCVELTTSDARLHARSMHSDHARTRPATHLSPQPPITHSPTLTLRTGYAHVLVPPLTPNPNY